MRLSQLQTIDNNVNQIIAGNNISITPFSGTGDVTISTLGSGATFPLGMNVSTITQSILDMSQQELDSVLLSVSNSIKYEIELSDTIDFHTTTLTITHNGSKLCYVEYGLIFTNMALGTLTAVIDNGSVKLVLMPNMVPLNVNIIRTMFTSNGVIQPPIPPSTIPILSSYHTTIVASNEYILDSIPYLTISSVKYNIQIKTESSYHVTEIFITHDNITSFISEYGTITTDGILGIFNVRLLNNNLELLLTNPTNIDVAFVKTVIGPNITTVSNDNDVLFIDSMVLPTIGSQVINQLPLISANTIKYDIQSSVNGDHHISQLLVLHDGVNILSTEYGIFYNNSILTSFDVGIVADSIVLRATPLVANLKVNMVRTVIKTIEPSTQYYSLEYNTTTTIEQVLDSISITTGNSFKYNIQIKNGVQYQCIELVVVHDGVDTYMTEYGELKNSTILATFGNRVNGNNFELLITPNISNVEIRALRMLIA